MLMHLSLSKTIRASYLTAKALKSWEFEEEGYKKRTKNKVCALFLHSKKDIYALIQLRGSKMEHCINILNYYIF